MTRFRSDSAKARAGREAAAPAEIVFTDAIIAAMRSEGAEIAGDVTEASVFAAAEAAVMSLPERGRLELAVIAWLGLSGYGGRLGIGNPFDDEDGSS